MNYYGSRNYVTVSVKAIRNNLKRLKKDYHLPLVMSVIKADGYGHGIQASVEALDEETDWYAVASFEEAKKIRDCHSIKPILVLGMIPLEHIQEAIQHNISCSIISLDYAQALSAFCFEHHCQMNCHLKLDTGFHRIGLKVEEATNVKKELAILYQLKNLTITGVYTHFAAAGSKKADDPAFTQSQFQEFVTTCQYIEEQYGPILLKHCCNSRASIYLPAYHMDMVRIGMFLYGLGPDEDREKAGLIPALEWKAKLVAVKEVKQGESVSYSRSFMAVRDMRIGIVACGFGDGYYRALFRCKKPLVIVNGIRCHILGKICMDYLMIELPATIDVNKQEVVTLIGKEGNEEVTANELANYVGGTGVEVTSQITARVKRVRLS